MNILGISAFYHDSAAVLLRGGDIVAAAQEERFSRKKHDSGFPLNAVKYCIREAAIGPEQVDFVVFYDKPLLKFERLIETYLQFSPRGLKSFLMAMPVWMKEKLFLPGLLCKGLNKAFGLENRRERLVWEKRLLFAEHHQSHMASAFFPSPFQEAAVLTVDGVGEYATTSLGTGTGNSLSVLKEICFPHSLGLLYSAFTFYTGFKVNSGEYKVMGLAPYGQPKYVQTIYDHLIEVKEDGSFALNMKYFDYCTGLTMTNRRFDELFKGPPRLSESVITQKEMDLARSVQVVIEETLFKILKSLYKETGQKNLCMAGGVALNCVANGKLLHSGPFDKIWIQPAAGDAGGALGAALAVWHQFLGMERYVDGVRDNMRGSYLGPGYSQGEIETYLTKRQLSHTTLPEEQLLDRVTNYISDGKVIGWFQGRMEFGPRALGARSIIGDARNADIQSIMNLKIKYRESFRPFAPSVLLENVSDYFELETESPYMLLVALVKTKRRIEVDNDAKLWGINLLNKPRSDIPAVTHIDYSARVHTVSAQTNPVYYQLINKFREKTGCSVVVNTSFNVRGEPIVCTPQDAYLCFMRTEMDYLVLGNCLLDKGEQKPLKNDADWREQYALD